MQNHSYKYKKKMNRVRMLLALFIAMLLFFLLIRFLLSVLRGSPKTEPSSESSTEAIFSGLEEPGQSGKDGLLAPFSLAETEEPVSGAPAQDPSPCATEFSSEETSEPASEAARGLEETDIYSFLQGPKAWEARMEWSGSWCTQILADQEFGAFGCGLCCLANIYSTITPYTCSPVDMFYYAQEVSDYAPVSGFGAIDWPYLRKTLKTVGITSGLKRKPVSYEQFRDTIASGICAIALVCSANDSTYWQNVSGHYVTLWLYHSDDETVFLADPGNSGRNRHRIPLRYVYDALKTASRYQYLLVTETDESENTWQHNGIETRWKKPRYLQK